MCDLEVDLDTFGGGAARFAAEIEALAPLADAGPAAHRGQPHRGHRSADGLMCGSPRRRSTPICRPARSAIRWRCNAAFLGLLGALERRCVRAERRRQLDRLRPARQPITAHLRSASQRWQASIVCASCETPIGQAAGTVVRRQPLGHRRHVAHGIGLLLGVRALRIGRIVAIMNRFLGAALIQRKNLSPHQLPHRAVQPIQGQRIHPPAHQLLHHLDRIGEVPFASPAPD